VGFVPRGGTPTCGLAQGFKVNPDRLRETSRATNASSDPVEGPAMEPIYDSLGQVCGWLDETNILDLDGRYRALIRGEHIYSYRDGTHTGWFEDGAIWDSSFTAVGFIDGVIAGLAIPGRSGTPGRPGRPGRPGTPGLSGVPGRPGRSNSWSRETWTSWAPPAV
jgi:hypothetical protein